jgi:hypothetical protein
VVNRRALVAAAPALLLAACGRKPAADSAGGANNDRGSQAQGDIEVLSFLLGVERAMVRGLSGYDRVREHDRAHAAAIERRIRRLGGTVPTDDGHAAHGHAAAIKRDALAAYVDSLPKLYDDDLQRLAASIFAVEAEHLAAITGEAADVFVVGERAA